MAKLTDEEKQKILDIIQDAVLHEKFIEGQQKLLEIAATRSHLGEKEKLEAIVDFVNSARSKRPFIVMVPLIELGRKIYGGRFQFFAACGDAIWGTSINPFANKSHPEKLLEVLFKHPNVSHRQRLGF